MGKEICDLLVVFPPHVLIFSDKYCQFPAHSSLEIAWQRWFRAAVLDASRQLRGAERWIRSYPHRVFVDPQCQSKLPIALPPVADMRVHRIVVAHGASEACRKHFGGSGSLMLKGSPCHVGGNQACVTTGPFSVSHVGGASGFVHVLDDTTTDLLLGTLTTVADFVSYLREKESYLSSRSLLAAGEEELLACYLTNTKDDGKHGFAFPDGKGLLIAEGFWQSFERHPSRIAQLEADRISYVWDGLIEHFGTHVLAGTVESNDGSDPWESEQSLRFLAREPRTRRRILAKSLLAVMNRAKREPYSVRLVGPSGPGDPVYVFLAIKADPKASRPSALDYRRDLLKSYCLVTRLVQPEALDIVGIGTDELGAAVASEDLLYFDTRQWNSSLEADARRIQEEMKILVNLKRTGGTEDEYPSTRPPNVSKGRSRNLPCGCGSGLKTKRCCGSRA